MGYFAEFCFLLLSSSLCFLMHSMMTVASQCHEVWYTGVCVCVVLFASYMVIMKQVKVSDVVRVLYCFVFCMMMELAMYYYNAGPVKCH